MLSEGYWDVLDCITQKEGTVCSSADSPVDSDMYSVASKSSYHHLSTVWIYVCHNTLWNSKVVCSNTCEYVYGHTVL